ncbi:MAG: HAD hydrolase family protein [candidate division Zixibacteria bacterium]|nr:HAD hydrolase family protein [candidate division Zixibacteria bacterium]
MTNNRKPSKARLAKIRLMIFDFDGVLTDNFVFVGEDGEKIKRFWVPDGVGIFMGHLAGIKFAIITGNQDRTTRTRAEFLRIDDVFQGAFDKKIAYQELKAKHQVTDAECLVIGDDVQDRPILELAGISVAPCDANPAMKKIAAWVGQSPGGRGIVREAIDAVLAARGYVWPPPTEGNE